jgi:hypothetical protein
MQAYIERLYDYDVRLCGWFTSKLENFTIQFSDHIHNGIEDLVSRGREYWKEVGKNTAQECYDFAIATGSAYMLGAYAADGIFHGGNPTEVQMYASLAGTLLPCLILMQDRSIRNQGGAWMGFATSFPHWVAYAGFGFGLWVAHMGEESLQHYQAKEALQQPEGAVQG